MHGADLASFVAGDFDTVVENQVALGHALSSHRASTVRRVLESRCIVGQLLALVVKRRLVVEEMEKVSWHAAANES